MLDVEISRFCQKCERFSNISDFQLFESLTARVEFPIGLFGPRVLEVAALYLSS